MSQADGGSAPAIVHSLLTSPVTAATTASSFAATLRADDVIDGAQANKSPSNTTEVCEVDAVAVAKVDAVAVDTDAQDAGEIDTDAEDDVEIDIDAEDAAAIAKEGDDNASENRENDDNASEEDDDNEAEEDDDGKDGTTSNHGAGAASSRCGAAGGVRHGNGCAHPWQNHQRVRRSRSKKANDAAARQAASYTDAVKVGKAPMPKRNQQVDVDVARLGLLKIGPFWFSRSGKSPCFIDRIQHSILRRIAPFFEDAGKLQLFTQWRSGGASDGVSLRVVDNFYTNWCKANSILVAETDQGMLVDVKEDYNAMLARYNKTNFDPFNRGLTCVIFETPAHDATTVESRPSTGWQPHSPSEVGSPQPNHSPNHSPTTCGSGASVRHAGDCAPPAPQALCAPCALCWRDTGRKDGCTLCAPALLSHVPVAYSDVRRVSATTVGQLHFFHWLMNNRQYQMIASRCSHIHASMSGSIQRNRREKAQEATSEPCGPARKRRALSREHRGPHVLAWPCTS